jgi:hypothetical protein
MAGVETAEDGMWPNGKAIVFGTGDCRFESYHSKDREREREKPNPKPNKQHEYGRKLAAKQLELLPTTRSRSCCLQLQLQPARRLE